MDRYAGVMERFVSKIQKDSEGCWIWQGTIDRRFGYGFFYYDNRQVLAHRFSYQACNLESIEGKHVHHLCENPPCVNPSHLKALSPSEHVAVTPRNKSHRFFVRGACANGHAFNAENTVIIRDSAGRVKSRQCRVCGREGKRRRYTPQLRRSNSSGYKGVYPVGDRWRAVLRHKHKSYHIGYFSNPMDAAVAYNEKALEVIGKHARLNVV